MNKIFEVRFGPSEEEMERTKREGTSVWSADFTLPQGAKILRVNTRILRRMQTVIDPATKEMRTAEIGEECMSIWGEADSGAAPEKNTFYSIGTGDLVPENTTYVGTYLLQAGAYAFHVYRMIHKE